MIRFGRTITLIVGLGLLIAASSTAALAAPPSDVSSAAAVHTAGTAATRLAASPAATNGCYSLGGGKYNCYVWTTAPSFFGSGARAGTLYAGWNYFYCQARGGEYTFEGYRNYWWGLTE